MKGRRSKTAELAESPAFRVMWLNQTITVEDIAKACDTTCKTAAKAARRAGLPRRTRGGKGQPVEIDGVPYASISIAARALGVTEWAIARAMKRGQLDRVSIQRAAGDERRGRPGKPVVIDGVSYASVSEASRRTGLSRWAANELAEMQETEAAE